jgi:hypothetical protein
MIAWGERKPSLKLALQIHRKIGLKLGPLDGLTDKQIKVLAETVA